ncbi:MAG: PQQ-binding-like beta-propeller repeat protein [Sedimentisphaerales bacterium]|nr:PQQ-binding-like beta-propeller repeat protein [Sedimentisphaerales bacterium]
MRWVFSAAVVYLVSLSTASGEDWPCFRGPGRQGISQEKETPTQWNATSGIRWKTSIPGEGWSSPIVLGDRIFVTTAFDKGASLHLICLDRVSGTLAWDKELVRQKAGHKSQQNSYATSTPATDGQRVYVVTCDGRILGVSMDGAVEWVNCDFDYYSEHGLAISPVLYNDLVIVCFDWSSPGPNTRVGWQIAWDKAAIFAVDKNTGKVRWKGSRGSSRVAHVVPQIASVNGQDQLVSGAGDVVQGFDLKTGERLWTVSSPGEGVVPSVVVGDGLAFTASGFGESRICAVRLDGARGDVTGTHTVWESRDDVPKMSSMLYVSPHLYLVTESGVAKCMRGATGEVLWRERLRGPFSASPVWADGKIYFLSEKGITTVVEDGPQFKVLATNELGEKCCASPAVSQGNLFLRAEKTLYCIGK